MPTQGQMSSPAEHTRSLERCAECGARVRPDDEWCTLCLTPVASPEPPVEPRLADEPGPVVAEAAVGDRGEAAERAVAEAAERLLIELRAGETHRLPPRLAAIRPRTKGAEALLACAGGLLTVGVLFGALYVVGRFL
jgi:hypothetical protein